MSAASLTLDESSLPAGAPEELAGPPHRIAPVTRGERISTIDTLRGFALLGILAMNITSFGLPAWAYNIPLSTPLPVFHGPHWRANTVTWFLRWIFFEGKMRAVFSMLFGAGVILLTSRAEARGAGERTADIFLRRNMWLVLIGFLHCYLIWEGDILYLYGMMGLLFLFPMRRLEPRTLLRAGTLVLLFNSLVMTGGMAGRAYHTRNAAAAAHKLELSGRPLTPEQGDDLKAWSDLQNDWRPPQKKVDEDVKAMRGGYLSAQAHRAKHAFQSETFGLYFGFGDVLGFMLLGMGLYKNGFLTAKLADRTYALTALVGLGIAWPLAAIGCYEAWHSHFDMFTTGWWLFTPFDLTRAGGAFGLSALLLLALKHGLLKPLTRPLAAVGQTALSNYLLTSIVCKLLFVWSPLHWYGRLEFFELYLVIAAVWAVNLLWSPLWLRHFLFGPVEWLWRSLTYWQRQPMRLHPTPLRS